jgi:hypothetical protein
MSQCVYFVEINKAFSICIKLRSLIMKSNKILSLAVASVLGMASTGVSAATTLDFSGTTAATASKYAEERMNVESATAMKLPDTVKFAFGTSLPATTERYIRIDLGGVKFKTSLTAPNNAIQSSDSNAFSTDTVSSGGNANNTYIVNTIKDDTGRTSADTFLVDFTAESFALTAKTITMQYRFYETETCAANPALATCAPLYDSGVKTIGEVTSAVKLTPTTTSDQTAVVKKEYKSFSETADVYLANLGKVQVSVDTSMYKETGTSVVASDIFGAETALVINGDFSVFRGAKSRVSFNSSIDCTSTTGTLLGGKDQTTNETTVAADMKSATIKVGSSATEYNLCLNSDEISPIPASAYTIDLVPVAAGGATVTGINQKGIAAGSIKRDGVQLQASFSSSLTATANRIICNNSSTTAAKIFSVEVFKNDGVTATLGAKATEINAGTVLEIPANGRLALQMTDLVTSLSAGTAFGIGLNIGGQPSQINCTYQLLLPGSDVQTVVQMWEYNY